MHFRWGYVQGSDGTYTYIYLYVVGMYAAAAELGQRVGSGWDGGKEVCCTATLA